MEPRLYLQFDREIGMTRDISLDEACQTFKFFNDNASIRQRHGMKSCWVVQVIDVSANSFQLMRGSHPNNWSLQSPTHENRTRGPQQ